MEEKDSSRKISEYLLDTQKFCPVEYHVEINIYDGYEDSWDYTTPVDVQEDDLFLSAADPPSFDQITGRVNILFRVL